MNKEKNRILNHLRYDLNIKQVFVERQCWNMYKIKFIKLSFCDMC